jgi:hypothetical protein
VGGRAPDIVERLREQAINTSATLAEWAVIDMSDKNATTGARGPAARGGPRGPFVRR